MIITEFCTGCRACEQLCTNRCISMRTDKEGFLISDVSEAGCIDCGLCTKICPQNKIANATKPHRVVALRYKDDKVLLNSASGGAFVGMAATVLEQDGVVYGAAYQRDLTVVHIAVESICDLKKLQSSKYVQSDTLNTYSDVKTMLRGGREILYSGTPCQIGGLYAYLGRDYPNLLTAEIICHGVPSPKLFAKYLEWLKIKYNEDILHYDFRDKTAGWGLRYKTKTKTKTIHISARSDPYYWYFLQGYTYRECCYRCKYATEKRISDFTLGDYWGIQSEHPSFYDMKGISLMLINTDKAEKWFENNKHLFYTQESSFDKASKWNENLIRPTKRPEIRDAIYEKIDQLDAFEYFNTAFPLHSSMYDKLKDKIPMSLFGFLKRITFILKNIIKLLS